MARTGLLGLSAIALALGCGARTPLAEGQATDAGADAPPILNTSFTIALGSYHTCTTRIDNALYCWGGNSMGQLGDGTDTDRSLPVRIALPEGAITSLAAGFRHTCVALVGGDVYCWGENPEGQVGVSDAGYRVLSPTRVPLPALGLGGINGIAAGEYHTCAVLSDGRLFCWGSDHQGQLGLGVGSTKTAPTQVPLPGNAVQVTAGDFHTCALVQVSSQAKVYCWGQNFHGQMGDGTTQDRPSPVQTSLSKTVRLVRSRGFFNLAIPQAVDAEGRTRLVGWGDNAMSVLLDTPSNAVTVPTDVGPLWNFADFSAGLSHACVVRWVSDAPTETHCWGTNGQGQLGDGTTISRATPKSIGVAINAYHVEAGLLHTCAIGSDGRVWCWGDNQYGQIGDGTQTPRLSPVQVKGF